MLLNILWLLVGLALILWGANALVDGASSVARKFNISNLVIGLTIVAFGTSMPEFMVTFISSVKGSTDLAIGNIVGSNLFNTLMIVGVSALIMPIHLGKGMLTREIPFALLSSVVLCLLACDAIFGSHTSDMLTRADGLILLCFFAIFLRYVFATAHNTDVTEGGEKNKEKDNVKQHKMWKSVLFIVLGLAALIGGGELFVNGATGLAVAMGASESIIGLTIVAAGTSLPELATSVVAAIKKNSGIAIGNVVGSNIFNIFFILGISSTIQPMSLGGITCFDFGVLLFSGLFLWIVSKFFGNHVINRFEGAAMVLCYVAYIAYLIVQQ